MNLNSIFEGLPRKVSCVILFGMRDYELVLVLKSDLTEVTREKLVEKVKKWIQDSGGKLASVDIWGKKELAYPIKKQNEGIYLLLNFSGNPPDLEKKIKIEESILRYLLVRKEKGGVKNLKLKTEELKGG